MKREGLSDYAKAHLIMTEIDRRFEAVIARPRKHPYRDWRVDMARTTARYDRNNFPSILSFADRALR